MKLTSGKLAASAAALFGSLLLTTPAQAVTINALYSSFFTCPAAVCGINPATIVSLQGNLTAQAAINAAANQIASQFNNNMTTNILFYGVHGGANGFLAASESGNTVYSYSQYTAALAADAATHPGNTTLNSAVAHLASGNGAGNPNAFVAANTTDARVLGLNLGATTAFGQQDSTPQFNSTGLFTGGSGTADGIVLLNLDQPFSYSRPVQPVSSGVAYDAQTAMEHEIDEVLGIGGAGSLLNTAHSDPNYASNSFGVNGSLFGTLDLFRYSGLGTPSFDATNTSITGCTNPSICTGAPSPYFSVDGGLTSIDTFNQAFPLIGGDAGDWGLNLFKLCPGNGGIGGTGDVQDAFSCNNQSPDVTFRSPSGQALDAIGYTPSSTPEPGTWALMLIGFGGLGAALRAARRRAAAA